MSAKCPLIYILNHFIISNLFSFANVLFLFYAFQNKKYKQINTFLLNKYLNGDLNNQLKIKMWKYLVLAALWGLRLVRPLLSLSIKVERLPRLWMSVCFTSSGGYRVWKLASRISSCVTETVHPATKTINVC